MVEHLPVGYDEELHKFGERFLLQDRDRLLELLMSGDRVRSLGRIQEHRPEVSSSNDVDLAFVDYIAHLGEHVSHGGALKVCQVETEGGAAIFAIHKPFSGESRMRRHEYNVTEMYTRERYAYCVDYYAGLGVVPPTVIREVDGELGSLQLYIPPDLAEVPKRVKREIDWEKFANTEDFQAIVALHLLIYNADVNDENILIGQDNDLVISIDHGCSMCQKKRGDNSHAIKMYQKYVRSTALQPRVRACLENLVANEAIFLTEIPDSMAARIETDMSPNPILLAKAMLADNSLLPGMRAYFD